MRKSADAFRTISEVAAELGVPKHVLRFWEGKFPQVRPMKRGGGRRYYRREDLDLLRGIQHLLHSDGYTIKGVQKILREKGVETVKQAGAPPDDTGMEDLGVADRKAATGATRSGRGSASGAKRDQTKGGKGAARPPRAKASKAKSKTAHGALSDQADGGPGAHSDRATADQDNLHPIARPEVSDSAAPDQHEPSSAATGRDASVTPAPLEAVPAALRQSLAAGLQEEQRQALLAVIGELHSCRALLVGPEGQGADTDRDRPEAASGSATRRSRTATRSAAAKKKPRRGA